MSRSGWSLVVWLALLAVPPSASAGGRAILDPELWAEETVDRPVDIVDQYRTGLSRSLDDAVLRTREEVRDAARPLPRDLRETPAGLAPGLVEDGVSRVPDPPAAPGLSPEIPESGCSASNPTGPPGFVPVPLAGLPSSCPDGSSGGRGGPHVGGASARGLFAFHATTERSGVSVVATWGAPQTAPALASFGRAHGGGDIRRAAFLLGLPVVDDPGRERASPLFWAIAGAGASLLPAWVLYRRLLAKDLLANDTRRAVYERVLATPGTTAGRIASELGLDRRTALHHLLILGEYGAIAELRVGRRMRYYKNGGAFDEREKRIHAALASTKTRRVLAVLRDLPGRRSLGAVATAAGIPKSTVRWHVERLRESGVLDADLRPAADAEAAILRRGDSQG
ncbi:MAG: helix-turn-helix domain-containing protein [Methanobacteriota archaeon]